LWGWGNGRGGCNFDVVFVVVVVVGGGDVVGRGSCVVISNFDFYASVRTYQQSAGYVG